MPTRARTVAEVYGLEEAFHIADVGVLLLGLAYVWRKGLLKWA